MASASIDVIDTKFGLSYPSAEEAVSESLINYLAEVAGKFILSISVAKEVMSLGETHWYREVLGAVKYWASELVLHMSTRKYVSGLVSELGELIRRGPLSSDFSMDELIDFFLFQLPPSIVPTENFIDNLEYFIKEVNLGPRFALEFRNEAWFSTKWIQWLKRLEVTMVSVDAPQLPREIYCTTGIVYLRMHGRTAWYAHNYSFDELREVAIKIIRTSPQKAYIFFNNNHDMLHNAHELQSIFNELIKYNRFYA